MSPSILLAPMRNRCACNQLLPNSSFISDSHSTDCFAVRTPPAGLKPTAMPVSSAYSRIARVMTRPTGNVALTDSLPVEVLMKSAPAIIATRLAFATLRKVARDGAIAALQASRPGQRKVSAEEASELAKLRAEVDRLGSVVIDQAVEFGRKTIPSQERPTIDVVENETISGTAASGDNLIREAA